MRPGRGDHFLNQLYGFGLGNIIEGHAQNGDGWPSNRLNVQGKWCAHGRRAKCIQSPLRHSSWIALPATTQAAAKPGAGVSSNMDQLDKGAKPSGSLSSRADSPGTNDTSTWSSKCAMPSPVALSQASFRVHRLKNAVVFCSWRNEL